MNNQKKEKTISRILMLVLVSGLCAALYAGVLRKADLSLSDSLYQKRRASDGMIALIGIDDRALEEFGPFQTWKRDIITEVIRVLNKSEDIHPAVIGVDVIFGGVSDPELDQMLADTAGRYGNVVMGSAAEFGTKLETREDGSRKLVSGAVIGYTEPYQALAESVDIGYVNAMLDDDGIFRHHMLEMELPDGTIVPSFAKKIAEKYLETAGGQSLILPQTKNSYWYMPFTGYPGDYDEGISVSSIINGEIPPEVFAGRIVLIGPYAAGLQDQYVGSIDHGAPFYGVEIQANVVEALLRGKYPSEVDPLLQIAAVWLILSVCGFIFLRIRIRYTTLIWAAGSALWLLLCRQMAVEGVLLQVLWIPVPLTLMYIGTIAYNAVLSVREKRQITNMFSHYVAPEIVQELVRMGPEGLQLGGRVARIAVLFVDVRGFTTMSEMLEPTEVVAILNEYLTLITDCVLRNQGTLDKFVGDAAMAVWGSPLPQEDYVMHAVQAGIDMVKGSEALSRKLEEQYGRTVAFGIGVNVGDAVVGNMGAAIHMDYTAIGDTVNTAARLEANAPGGHVYLSRAVAEELGDRISYTSLGGTIRLKGKKEGFEVLDLHIPEQ